jgi:uncharacterized peroxidase-related enzyme
MTWINTPLFKNADEPLKQIFLSIFRQYPPEFGETPPALQKADGSSDSIIAVHSLIPLAMTHIFSTCAVLFSPQLPLTRRQQEIIALVVSTQNHCHYSIESHEYLLRKTGSQLSDDDVGALAQALRRDHTQAKLNSQDRAMVDFCIRLTKHPARMIEADVIALRSVGFDDTAILQITMIAAWFNYANRVADALGVGK